MPPIFGRQTILLIRRVFWSFWQSTNSQHVFILTVREISENTRKFSIDCNYLKPGERFLKMVLFILCNTQIRVQGGIQYFTNWPELAKMSIFELSITYIFHPRKVTGTWCGSKLSLSFCLFPSQVDFAQINNDRRTMSILSIYGQC